MRKSANVCDSGVLLTRQTSLSSSCINRVVNLASRDAQKLFPGIFRSQSGEMPPSRRVRAQTSSE